MENDNVKFKKINFNIAIILIFLFSACGIKNTNTNIKKARIKINNIEITAEVAETLDTQIKGLSGRKSLGENEGMLFVYSVKKIPTFWMKDMLFPIDIIWISDNKIIDISENLPIPENGEIKRVAPKESVNYVLEVNAGFAKNNDLKAGDQVQIILNKKNAGVQPMRVIVAQCPTRPPEKKTFYHIILFLFVNPLFLGHPYLGKKVLTR